MKTPFFVLPVVFLTFTVPSPSPAVEKPGDGAANRFILTKVRLLPKPGKARLLVGARIVGSNEGPTTAPEEMARIDRASADNGWWEVNIPPGKVFRYVKMDSASGAGLALAEIEFYSTTGRLRGNGFGTSVGKEQAAFSFDKALDGDPNTYFESPAEHSYVGIDLGSQSQAPAPHFSPAGGAYGQPQKIELSTWPPSTTIRYTTDGSVPSASNGQVYSKPLTVLATASVAAIASREGLADSDISIATYRVGAGAAAETQIKSYHIGNSLTDTVNGFLDPIALSAGRNFLFLRKTIPGAGIQLNFESCGKGFASPDA